MEAEWEPPVCTLCRSAEQGRRLLERVGRPRPGWPPSTRHPSRAPHRHPSRTPPQPARGPLRQQQQRPVTPQGPLRHCGGGASEELDSVFSSLADVLARASWLCERACETSDARDAEHMARYHGMEPSVDPWELCAGHQLHPDERPRGQAHGHVQGPPPRSGH
ncbi:uncharacterized protein LOC144932425 isoform X2 [Lampetra fluviatilis]